MGAVAHGLDLAPADLRSVRILLPGRHRDVPLAGVRVPREEPIGGYQTGPPDVFGDDREDLVGHVQRLALERLPFPPDHPDPGGRVEIRHPKVHHLADAQTGVARDIADHPVARTVLDAIKDGEELRLGQPVLRPEVPTVSEFHSLPSGGRLL